MTNEQICKASIYAQDVADHMNVAYWTIENQPRVFEMKYNSAHESFKKLAEVMGYNVELKE